MSKFTKKVCPACGGIFQQRKETHEYCSGTCRTKAFRQRHEIEEPSFLSQPKKHKESWVKLKERTKIVAGLADFFFLTIVEAKRFSGGSLASFLDIFFE